MKRADRQRCGGEKASEVCLFSLSKKGDCTMQIELAGNPVLLLPEKAMLLIEPNILVLADVHLGKATHFRKSGIHIPLATTARDYEVLNQLLLQYQPSQVWFLGDLFHSEHNAEWQQFAAFIRQWPDIHFTLLKGNHDIIPEQNFATLSVTIVAQSLWYQDICCTHEPLQQLPGGVVNVAGHIHPGCLIRSAGRQQYRLPCFYLKDNVLLLPAFGYLTGLSVMDERSAQIFPVFPDQVMCLQTN
jgi:DNA ligase-associated metallophosphoesterase